MSSSANRFLEYWNDETMEQSKRFFWLEQDQQQMIGYIRNTTNLERCLLAGLDLARDRLGPAQRVMEVAAGVGWAAALASVRLDSQAALAVDYSRHRLRFAPSAWGSLGADPAKLRIQEADFLALAPESDLYDAAIFCQAACMYEDLPGLFLATSRWLKPGGWLLVACETSQDQGLTDPQEPDASGRWIYGTHHYVNAMQQSGFNTFVQELSYPVYPALENQGDARNILGIKAGDNQ